MNQTDLDQLEARAATGDPAACEEYGLALLAADAPGSDQFDRGLAMLTQAAEAGRVDAQVALGHVHVQHPTLPGAPARARESFENAARQGDVHAVERLADLYLAGYGVPRDAVKACSLYRQLAEYGFPGVLCHTAYLLSEGLGCEPDEVEAASLILRAAAQGHTLAFFLAANRYWEGLGVPQDGVIAAAWMELASARGFPLAEQAWQTWLDGLDDSSRSRARELAERLKGNLRSLGTRVRELTLAEDHPEYSARFNELVVDNYRELKMAELDLDGERRGYGVRRRAPRSYRPEAISWRPRLFRIPDFATVEERAHLIELAHPLLKSTGDTRGAQRAIEVDAFDGDCAIFGPPVVTPVVRNLLQRFALMAQIPDTHFEPMSVLRYSVGHEYSPHGDFFDGQRMASHRQVGDLGGQRLATALICLCQAESGGETHYPVANATIAAEPGMAIMHYNATPDGLADPASLHHGRPIAAGEKWIARTAIREFSLYGDYVNRL